VAGAAAFITGQTTTRAAAGHRSPYPLMPGHSLLRMLWRDESLSGSQGPGRPSWLRYCNVAYRRRGPAATVRPAACEIRPAGPAIPSADASGRDFAVGKGAWRRGPAWRRRASRNPAAPQNAVSPCEAGAPRSPASRWEAAANPWLGAIARCSRTGSSNPSPSSGHRLISFRSQGEHYWRRTRRGKRLFR
jgi:hypothetical protein